MNCEKHRSDEAVCMTCVQEKLTGVVLRVEDDSVDLPKYGSLKECPKCGASLDPENPYRASEKRARLLLRPSCPGEVCTSVILAGSGCKDMTHGEACIHEKEVMHCHCICGYAWDEAPLDAEKAC